MPTCSTCCRNRTPPFLKARATGLFAIHLSRSSSLENCAYKSPNRKDAFPQAASTTVLLSRPGLRLFSTFRPPRSCNVPWYLAPILKCLAINLPTEDTNIPTEDCCIGHRILVETRVSRFLTSCRFSFFYVWRFVQGMLEAVPDDRVHLVQFTDCDNASTYGCCVTVTQLVQVCLEVVLDIESKVSIRRSTELLIYSIEISNLRYIVPNFRMYRVEISNDISYRMRLIIAFFVLLVITFTSQLISHDISLLPFCAPPRSFKSSPLRVAAVCGVSVGYHIESVNTPRYRDGELSI